jgi:uncharacterized protein YbjT (DUF2867 family)
MKKAILFGSSGFIGSFLLDELLNNSDYQQVTIVVRKNPNINHPKLKTMIGDYNSLLKLKENIIADEIFIALGTTKKNTPNRDQYYQVDHDYPVLASKIAKDNGAKSVFVVSAVGANSASSVFYIRTKGETERDIIALNFEHTHIFRPSMLMGSRKESRSMENVFIKIWSVINPILLGKRLKRYRGITGENVAKAINHAAKNQSEKVKIYYWQEMNDLL